MKGNLVFEGRVALKGEGAGWFVFLGAVNTVLEKRCKKFALIACGKKRSIILCIRIVK